MKKLISAILCMLLVFCLAAPAFAADQHAHTITIANSREGYTYAAYKIFKGVLSSSGVLSDIRWADGIDNVKLMEELLQLPAYAECKDAEDVATVLSKDKLRDNQTAQDFADIAAKYITTVAGTSQYTDNQYTIDVDGDGYYLIVNTEVPENATDTTYSRYMLEVVRNVTIQHKGTYPTVDKKIVEGTNKVTVNEASIGDAVKYEITGTLPNNIADYDTYFYRFTDTLSKGLTYDASDANLTVTVNGKDVTKYFYSSATKSETTKETTVVVSIQDLLALKLVAGVGEITKDSKIILTYSATLNEDAIIGNASGNIGNQNVVDLEYSNDPNNDGEGATNPPDAPGTPTPEHPTGKTPEKEVATYTTELLLQKVDGTGTPLTGAAFRLTGDGVNVVITTGQYFELPAEGETPTWYKLKNGTYTETAPVEEDNAETEEKDEKTIDDYETTEPTYVLRTKVTLDSEENTKVNVEAFVGPDGQLKFTGLGVGEYTLTETVTPGGFNSIDPITFEITFDAETKKFTGPGNIIIEKDDTNTLYVEVENRAGSTLPSTGGMGTTLFYIFGSILFTSAAVLLIAKKRMAE